MDEQLKALLEGINALKSGQEESKGKMENMQEEIKNELKETMEKGQQEMQKGQEELRNTLENKIDSVEEKITWKVEEKIAVVEEKIEKKKLNLNSLYNALDLRFSQKYSKDYARLQMKTRLQKTGESFLQEYASEVERLANLAFSDHPSTVREVISLQYFVDDLKEQKHRRL
ncbi:uncharacterized protein TNCV_3253781 [Trichonephila clavipes]|nr:uncharacterized protein TNCV_3253781 [Trichonephila clavipes]